MSYDGLSPLLEKYNNMPKLSPIDVITQQLEVLSIEQLIEVMKTIHALIKEQLLSDDEQRLLSLVTSFCSSSNRFDLINFYEVLLKAKNLDSTHLKKIDKEEESLKDVIELVDQWMSDESGYDEETYPQIVASLNQNRLFL